MEFLILIVLMVGAMWLMTSRGKKQQAAARQRVEDALVPGTWVMTIGGFFGRVVEADGDVVTLESPSGVETIWFKGAIKEPKEPPFAAVEEDEDAPADVVVPDDAASLMPPAGSSPVVRDADPIGENRPEDGPADEDQRRPRA
ncbi:preprotein translocase subunit YajC [Georgenia sp. TF02-10]|uniref:preprotein translocase subunit YajC n=1 Tax=Georgenia sp. TF02-10 TaxID=2917725 RepID=UPI001FA76845|nr:preprotein translocase subunit YajC [Georgenia sp. TF02-10]UNX53277.1 preprotein translocase subunit YajC [Georgenia sp. TF02-10]